MKRLLVLLITAISLICMLPGGSARALEPLGEDKLSISAASACLVERTSGELIYAKDAHTPRPPASVTKVMTMLLVMEACDSGALSLDDMISCSPHAASMGGSQIWLEEGEQMSASDMLKAVAVVSANDCAVALAEHLAGSEEGFVARMNERAAQLGMKDTHFVDCTGLTDDEAHLTSAYDIALMSRELLGHDKIREYTTIWMDTLRGGESGLTNTNKLVRFYNGATGLKTGFTSRAMYCLSASAMREGTEYIAVLLHAPSSAERFDDARTLLNYAFANYVSVPLRSPKALPPVRVELGCADSVQPECGGAESMLMERASAGEIRYEVTLPECVEAPVQQGQALGELTVYSGERKLCCVPLTACDAVDRLSLWQIYGRLLQRLFCF